MNNIISSSASLTLYNKIYNASLQGTDCATSVRGFELTGCPWASIVDNWGWRSLMKIRNEDIVRNDIQAAVDIARQLKRKIHKKNFSSITGDELSQK